MVDLNDTLLAVRYAGIPELPDTATLVTAKCNRRSSAR